VVIKGGKTGGRKYRQEDKIKEQNKPKQQGKES
jgi:hypothetical protein